MFLFFTDRRRCVSRRRLQTIHRERAGFLAWPLVRGKVTEFANRALYYAGFSEWMSIKSATLGTPRLAPGLKCWRRSRAMCNKVGGIFRTRDLISFDPDAGPQLTREDTHNHHHAYIEDGDVTQETLTYSASSQDGLTSMFPQTNPAHYGWWGFITYNTPATGGTILGCTPVEEIKRKYLSLLIQMRGVPFPLMSTEPVQGSQ